MKRVAILQSAYLPWKGYFDLIRLCDEFILYDEVQFSKGDWRNRNRIVTGDGLLWLTIPVRTRGRSTQSIREVEVSDSRWARQHWESIRHAYCRASCFSQIEPWLHRLFEDNTKQRFLSLINAAFLREISERLDILTPIRFSSAYPRQAQGKNQRLIELCQQTGADEYLSGPAASDYLNKQLFKDNGIRIRWMDYSSYPEYEQSVTGSFTHSVSIVDTLMNIGIEGTTLHLATTRREALEVDAVAC